MFGGGGAASQPQSRQQPQSGQNPFGENPLGKIFEGMLGGGGQQTGEATQRTQTREPNPSGRARSPYDDLFGDMFESGRKNRDDYEKNVGSIFDQFLQGMKRR